MPDRVYNRILEYGQNLISTARSVEEDLGMPIINKRVSVTPIALVAGGGVKGGTVIGSSSPDGQEVRNRPVLVGELYSTLLSMLRINPVKENKLAIGRAIKMADSDEPVTEMFI